MALEPFAMKPGERATRKRNGAEPVLRIADTLDDIAAALESIARSLEKAHGR